MKRDYIGELSGYIKKNLKKGYTKDSLKYALINQGHSRMEVEKAMKRVEAELSEEAPVLKTTPTITYEVIDSENASNDSRPWWKKFLGFK